ncbi:MAG TPA: UDPGP type 1 family protein [Pirellulales bacterium]|nr:UDPGP type 1 family protein [Pirellulales bacterium]
MSRPSKSPEQDASSPRDAVLAVSREELLAALRPFGQEHLLACWDSLSPLQHSALAKQIRSVDFARLGGLFQARHAQHDWAALARRAEGPPAVRLSRAGRPASPSASAETLSQRERGLPRQRGEQALAAGRVGVALVAGGQGTRLGFEHPKGMYAIGPVSNATLFQVLLEKIAAVGSRYGAPIALYLMTSPATHEESIAFLDAHDRFGLARDDVTIFCQGTMPVVDADNGRILLDAPGELLLSPDGHGGMPAALRASGALEDMRRRGIEQLFYMQVDNPLVGVCDAEFIGHHLLAGSELSTQVVAKHGPLDRMGNVVSIDGQVQIIEYSDLPDDAARQRLPDGSLKLWAGSIAVHVIDVSLVERMSDGQHELPFHLARKKAPHLDSGGRRVEPSEPNAIKFEQFIFDLLPFARQAIVVEVDEAQAFAPLKNEPGSERDSPESVRAQMAALHAAWLRQAGAEVAPGIVVEISPLFALDAAELAVKIPPGLKVTEPTYFHE